MTAESRLDRVMHLAIGMYRPFSFDPSPGRLETCAPGAGGGRRIAQPAALRAGLQVKIMLGAVVEIFGVLDVEIVDSEPHPQIFAANRHFVSPSSFPLSFPRKREPRGSQCERWPRTPACAGVTRQDLFSRAA